MFKLFKRKPEPKPKYVWLLSMYGSKYSEAFLVFHSMESAEAFAQGRHCKDYEVERKEIK